MEDMIMVRRRSRRLPSHWLKMLVTLGLHTFWWRSNYLGLTKRSVVRRTGVFTKEERAVPLNQVQDVSISYGFVRRLLGHGDIRIETAGSSGTEIIMRDVVDPEEFRAKVFELIDAFYDEEMPGKSKSADAETPAE